MGEVFLQRLHVALVVLAHEGAAGVVPLQHHQLALELRELDGLARGVAQREVGRGLADAGGGIVAGVDVSGVRVCEHRQFEPRLAALGMVSCGDRGGVQFWQRDGATSNACPRPASLTGSEFNAQETGLRALRRAAFRGDFFAQLELGARYSAVRATDKNIEDPIESSVWYAMALANEEGFAPINRVERGLGELASWWERYVASNPDVQAIVAANDDMALGAIEAAKAAGHADLVAPPTFPVVVQEATLAQLLAEPDAGIDFSRVVHGEQRFTYTRAIVAGDELTATLTVSSVKSLGGHNMVTADSDIVDAEGKHVVTAISTLVVRGDED